MKITQKGTDYISINEENINDTALKSIPRVHLIQLNFQNPTQEKIANVMNTWDKTNRFVVCDNIRVYNNLLKTTTKKYYICNKPGDMLISFMRKNNKVLLNFNNLDVLDKEYLFCSPNILKDLLRNVEVIELSTDQFKAFQPVFEEWSGNVIISDN
jgi:IS1 family transposase